MRGGRGKGGSRAGGYSFRAWAQSCDHRLAMREGGDRQKKCVGWVDKGWWGTRGRKAHPKVCNGGVGWVGQGGVEWGR